MKTIALSSLACFSLFVGAGCSSGTADLTKQEKAQFVGGPRPAGVEGNMANARAEFYKQHPEVAPGNQTPNPPPQAGK